MKLYIYSKHSPDADLLFHAAMQITNDLTQIDRSGHIRSNSIITGWFSFGERPRLDSNPMCVLTVELKDPHLSKEDLLRGLYDVARGLDDASYSEYGKYGRSTIGYWSYHRELRKKTPWWCFWREYNYERKSMI